MERESEMRRRSTSSLNRNRLSSAEFQLNLSQELPKVELKKVLTEFIQLIADTPELNIVQLANLTIEPLPAKKVVL